MISGELVPHLSGRIRAEFNTFTTINRGNICKLWNSSTYKALSSDMRSIASQFALITFMRRHRLSSLKELYPILAQHKTTTENEIRNGDWRKRLTGTALSKVSFKCFNQATKYRCLPILNHCLWLILEQNEMLFEKPYNVIYRLPRKVRLQLLTKPIQKTSTFDELAARVKRSYKQQRHSLYSLGDLNGYTALLLCAIFQNTVWHQKRPNTAEVKASLLFKELFDSELPNEKTNQLKGKVESLLSFYGSHLSH